MGRVVLLTLLFAIGVEVAVGKVSNKQVLDEVKAANQQLLAANKENLAVNKEILDEVRALKQQLAQTVAPPKQPTCPPDFTQANGCYKVVLDELEWSVAGLRCRSLHKDAHLVIIDNAQEHENIVRMLSNYTEGKYFWTGGQRIDPSRATTFVWKTNPTDGSTGATGDMMEMTYSNWHGGQPDNYGTGQSCIGIFPDWNYEWDDGECTHHCSSICELDM